jgi:hypothetical protein
MTRGLSPDRHMNLSSTNYEAGLPTARPRRSAPFILKVTENELTSCSQLLFVLSVPSLHTAACVCPQFQLLHSYFRNKYKIAGYNLTYYSLQVIIKFICLLSCLFLVHVFPLQFDILLHDLQHTVISP